MYAPRPSRLDDSVSPNQDLMCDFDPPPPGWIEPVGTKGGGDGDDNAKSSKEAPETIGTSTAWRAKLFSVPGKLAVPVLVATKLVCDLRTSLLRNGGKPGHGLSFLFLHS